MQTVPSIKIQTIFKMNIAALPKSLDGISKMVKPEEVKSEITKVSVKIVDEDAYVTVDVIIASMSQMSVSENLSFILDYAQSIELHYQYELVNNVSKLGKGNHSEYRVHTYQSARIIMDEFEVALGA